MTPEDRNSGVLTPQQQRACDEYLVHGGRGAAMLVAGYSEAYARHHATDFFALPQVAAYIEQQLESESMGRSEVLARTAAVARRGEEERNRLKALELIGKQHGLFSDSRKSIQDYSDAEVAIDVNRRLALPSAIAAQKQLGPGLAAFTDAEIEIENQRRASAKKEDLHE